MTLLTSLKRWRYAERYVTLFGAININIEMSSLKSSENIQKKEGGRDRSFSDNYSSSVTLNELAMKAKKKTVISSFQQGSHTLTDY